MTDRLKLMIDAALNRAGREILNATTDTGEVEAGLWGAEVAEMTRRRDEWKARAERAEARIAELEAERDVLVAGAYEAAKKAVADLPYGQSEGVAEGHEQAYRALEALTTADAKAALEPASGNAEGG